MSLQNTQDHAKYTSALSQSHPSHTDILSYLYPDHDQASHDHVAEMIPPSTMVFSGRAWHITYDLSGPLDQQLDIKVPSKASSKTKP